MGKGKGMNGGVREGNGLGEMVQFFYFFYLFIKKNLGGGERGTKMKEGRG